MTSLIPFFVKTGYKDEPMFKNSRVVYSSYLQDMEETFSPNFTKKLKMDGVSTDDMKLYKDPTMAKYSHCSHEAEDGVIKGCDTKNATVESYLKKSNKPVLEYKPFDDEGAFVNACSDFYDELLEQEPVLQD